MDKIFIFCKTIGGKEVAEMGDICQMKKKPNYMTLGMLIGTAIGAAICFTLYAFTREPMFIAFSGLGAAFGMVYGVGLGRKSNRPL